MFKHNRSGIYIKKEEERYAEKQNIIDSYFMLKIAHLSDLQRSQLPNDLYLHILVCAQKNYYQFRSFFCSFSNNGIRLYGGFRKLKKNRLFFFFYILFTFFVVQCGTCFQQFCNFCVSLQVLVKTYIFAIFHGFNIATTSKTGEICIYAK